MTSEVRNSLDLVLLKTDNIHENDKAIIGRPFENEVNRWMTDTGQACCRTVLRVPARWSGRTHSAARVTDRVTSPRCPRRSDADVR